MSWLITARTYSEIRDACSIILQDTGNAIFTDAQLNQHIKDALAEISNYVPYLVKDESKTMTGGSKKLDVSDIKDIIEIVKAEYYVDKDPQQFRNVVWYDQHNIRIITDIEPTTGDACYLYIKKRHHLDPLWVASTAYVKGDFVSPTKANRTGYRYECTTAGTSHSSEPTWGTTVGGTTSDNDVVWTCRGEVPNSLKDGFNDLEDLFIELVVARALESEAIEYANKVAVGGAKAMSNYIAISNRRLQKALFNLRAVAKPNMKQWYPTG